MARLVSYEVPNSDSKVSVESHSDMELSLHLGNSVLIVEVRGPAGVVFTGGVLKFTTHLDICIPSRWDVNYLKTGLGTALFSGSGVLEAGLGSSFFSGPLISIPE